MRFSPEQDAALKAVDAWLVEKPGKRGTPQVFRLFGFAGTGKTTIARHIAEGIDGKVLFAAFTGKAALVMERKGCHGATTLHALIYKPQDSGSETPNFELWDKAPAGKAKLIVIDECSMVDAQLAEDVLSFGVPVLVLGDPAQLPPVSGGGYFTDAEPDVMLTEVHRQALDNPIIRLSLDLREGRGLQPGIYGESQVVARADLDPERVTRADQVLVGRNKTRQAYNQRFRRLRGFDGLWPVAGDRLVCLRNNKKKRLFNGSLWTVKEATERPTFLKLAVAPEEMMGAKLTDVSVRKECFTGDIETLDWQARRAFDEFDYGYVLTVHKAQGSQWDDVCLFDESYVFADARAKWLYTGVTRAAERVTVVV